MGGERDVVKKYILDMWGNYSETVLDHALSPRNVGSIPGADGFGEGAGECEDTLAIWLRVVDDRVADARFWTDGCGTTIACGSMVTELVKGKTIKEAFLVDASKILEALGGLPRENVHCAFLAADALKKALNNYLEVKGSPWKRPYREA